MPEPQLAELLAPATLARIDDYLLLAKVVVEGFIAGQHRSVYQGTGSEFLQYRDYTPGDDLKYVDWKVFARRDRFYTKQFQEETNMQCGIVLDASASMDYGGRLAPCTKFRYGAMIAACLAYLATRQGDSVGFYCYSDDLKAAIAPGNRTGHLRRICTELQRVRPDGQARHDKALRYVGEALQRKGVVIVISDFLGAEEALPASLRLLRCAHHECIACHVLDSDETGFPFSRTTRFVDSETGDHIVTAPQAVRDDYLRSLMAFLARARSACLDSQIDYVQAETSANLGATLAAYLHRRGAVY